LKGGRKESKICLEFLGEWGGRPKNWKNLKREVKSNGTGGRKENDSKSDLKWDGKGGQKSFFQAHYLGREKSRKVETKRNSSYENMEPGKKVHMFETGLSEKKHTKREV